jgi:uncharacterized protein YjbK
VKADRHHEVELKRRLVGPGAADKLIAALGAPVREDKRQRNHIFDTDDGRLHRSRFALRLRVEEGAVFLTAKGPGRSVGASTGSKLEAETRIESALAEAILAGERDVLAELRDRVRDPAYESLWRGMDAALAGTAVRSRGSFENRRRTIPVDLPGGLQVDVEVDQTRFSRERADEEVEIELPDEQAVAVAEAWLERLTRDAGIATAPSSPKIARFYEARAETTS